MQALDIVSTTICAIYEIINKGMYLILIESCYLEPHMDHIWLIWQMLSANTIHWLTGCLILYSTILSDTLSKFDY